MDKLNCWEYKKCGRELGGEKVEELGACPATTESRINGVNGGKNGGRACWMIDGTLCNDKVQGTYTTKFQDCILCDFYKIVMEEEGPYITNSFKILSLLKT